MARIMSEEYLIFLFVFTMFFSIVFFAQIFGWRATNIVVKTKYKYMGWIARCCLIMAFFQTIDLFRLILKFSQQHYK